MIEVVHVARASYNPAVSIEDMERQVGFDKETLCTGWRWRAIDDVQQSAR
jgi:hypothetical protein